MTITWKVLGQAQLTGGNSSVYTAPASTRATVTAAQVWNPTAGNVTVDVYLLKAAGAAGDGTKIERIVLPPGTSRTVFGLINHKVEPGGSIVASGAGVTLTVSGAESVA